MKEKLMYALLCTVLFFGVAFAQERTVTGVVKDEAGTPLPGASVLVKGTSHGVATDFDGKYSIKVPNDKAVLVFSSLGAKTVERPVGTNKVINVTFVYARRCGRAMSVSDGGNFIDFIGLEKTRIKF